MIERRGLQEMLWKTCCWDKDVAHEGMKGEANAESELKEVITGIRRHEASFSTDIKCIVLTRNIKR